MTASSLAQALSSTLPEAVAERVANSLHAYLEGKITAAELEMRLADETAHTEDSSPSSKHINLDQGDRTGSVTIDRAAPQDRPQVTQHVHANNNSTVENVTQVSFGQLRIGLYLTQPVRSGIPTCPVPNASELLGRRDYLRKLIGQLIAEDSSTAAIAVRGLPGVGKTDLLRTVGCDSRITMLFERGVLYAELGPKPDVLTILHRWISELGHDAPVTEDAETLAATVRQALGDRRALLIIDDVWKSSLRAAKILRGCASPVCRLLVSSRSPEIAAETARGNEPVVLDVLSPEAAFELLRRHAPDEVQGEGQAAAMLVSELGYLPLALKLAGRLLSNDRRSSRPCAALLSTWRRRLNQLSGYEERSGLADERLSLEAIIGLSYEALPDDATRSAAASLAVFGATPLDWHWDAMAAVWTGDETQVTVWEEELINSGLCEYDTDARRYSLHQTVEAFLSKEVSDEAGYRHASFYANLMHDCEEQLDSSRTMENALSTLDREIEQMERGQRRAAEADPTSWWDVLLLFYAFGCFSYFSRRGRYAQLIAWSEDGLRAAQHGEQEAQEARLLNNIAVAYKSLEQFPAAVRYYKRSLKMKQRNGDVEGFASTISNLAGVHTLQGHHKKAIVCMNINLQLRRLLEDRAGMARGLLNLVGAYTLQNRYDEALEVYEENRELVDTEESPRMLAQVSLTLGDVYKGKGNEADSEQRQALYEKAISNYRQSLQRFKRIGDIPRILATQERLGSLYFRQDLYELAAAYLSKCMKGYEALGDLRNSARVSWKLGQVYGARGDLEAALPLMERRVVWEEESGSEEAAVHRAEVEELRSKFNDS